MEGGVMKSEEFTDIYGKYYKRIYNFCYYRLGNHHDAEDVTSMIFERVIVKYHTYDNKKSPFEAWLFLLARNTVADHFRTAKRKPVKIPLEKIAEYESGNAEGSPDDQVVERELNDLIVQTVNELPEKERSIISLKYAAGLTSAVIADVLGMTDINVRVSLSRALKKLNKKLLKKGVNWNEE